MDRQSEHDKAGGVTEKVPNDLRDEIVKEIAGDVAEEVWELILKDVIAKDTQIMEYRRRHKRRGIHTMFSSRPDHHRNLSL